jgi:HEAT repeat protein
MNRTFFILFNGSIMRYNMVSETVKKLVEQIKQGDYNSQMDAVYALKASYHEEAKQELLLQLPLNKNDHYIYDNITRALGLMGDESVVIPLMEMLKNSSSLEQKHSILMTLGTVSEPVPVELVASLIPLAENDERLLLTIIWVLGRTGNAKALPSLVRFLSDKREQVRKQVIEALAKLDDDGATLPFLLKLAADTNYSQRLYAINALSNYSSSEVEQLLIQIILDEQEEDVKLAALEAITNSASKKTVDILSDLLRSPSTAIRSISAWVLGNIGEPSVCEKLYELSEDAPVVLYSAGTALGKLGDKRAAQLLHNALKTDNFTLRANITEQLIKYENNNNIKALLENFREIETMGNQVEITTG